MENTKEYIPYGLIWEKEMKKLSKDDLIKMIRQCKTGSGDSSLVAIETAQDASLWVATIINDLADGKIDRGKAKELLGEYTARIMNIFWENAKAKFNENPELLK